MAEQTYSVAPSERGSMSPPTAQSGLIVFVHGLHPLWSANSNYDGIKDLFKTALPACDWYSFSYLGTYWSCANPEALCERLRSQVKTEFNRADKNYEKLYLVGHSFGALLVRQAILNGIDNHTDNEWLDKVERVVLLAGTNRGFQPYNRWLEFLTKVARLLPLLPPWIPFGKLAVRGLRGSDWVTSLRMRWAKISEQLPFTVQILGTQDRLVGPTDSQDVSVGRKAHQIRVDGVGHRDLALLVRQRKEFALEKLKPAIEAALAAEPHAASAAGSVDHVIFLIHGIRDFAEWHEDLSEIIMTAATAINKKVEIVSISYGYFSAFQFLFPIARRRCARSFLDRYVQYYARYPKAQFSALAHSNGTYALTWALRKNRYIELENVLLAGSVLPRKYAWQDLGSRVTRVRNDCARGDMPVGVLCWLLSLPYARGLGTAGVFGFKGVAVAGSASGGGTRVRNNWVSSGGHSAALETKYHEEIATFLLTSKFHDSGRAAATPVRRIAYWLLRWCVRAISIGGLVGCGYLFYLISLTGMGALATVVVAVGLTLLLICILLLI